MGEGINVKFIWVEKQHKRGEENLLSQDESVEGYEDTSNKIPPLGKREISSFDGSKNKERGGEIFCA